MESQNQKENPKLCKLNCRRIGFIGDDYENGFLLSGLEPTLNPAIAGTTFICKSDNNQVLKNDNVA